MTFPALERRPRFVGSALALVCGAVFALTAPPTDLHVLVFVGLMGFAWLLRRPDTWRVGALYGLFFGAGANLVALRFVPAVIERFTSLPHAVAWLAWALLSFAQGLSWALAGGLAVGLRKRGVPTFLAFAVGVYAGFFAPALFPWTPAGGLSPWPVLVQSADTLGERGVSLVVALVCALVVEALTKKGRVRARHAFAAGAIMVVVLGYGAHARIAIEEARAHAKKARIGLIQPSTEATVRWEPSAATTITKRLHDLTKVAESHDVDVTVWPEAAFPYTLSHGSRQSPPAFTERSVLAVGLRGPVIVGLTLSKNAQASTNSVMVARADGSLSAPYDKRHLLAFGEHVPFAEEIPWMKKTFARGTGLVPGTESTPLVAGRIRAGILVCYEDNLPEAGREAMSGAPNVLVNLTNDAWFSGSAEGELHLRLSVLRAIETRRDLARAVNLGPTSLVDATGAVRFRYDATFPKAVEVEVALLETPPTFYVRFGDAPVIALAGVACILHMYVASRRKPREAKRESPSRGKAREGLS